MNYGVPILHGLTLIANGEKMDKGLKKLLESFVNPSFAEAEALPANVRREIETGYVRDVLPVIIENRQKESSAIASHMFTQIKSSAV